MPEFHVHTRNCTGVAIITYRRLDGQTATWPISASMCPDNPSTPESIRAHFERHRPGCEWVGVEIIDNSEWERRTG